MMGLVKIEGTSSNLDIAMVAGASASAMALVASIFTKQAGLEANAIVLLGAEIA